MASVKVYKPIQVGWGCWGVVNRVMGPRLGSVWVRIPTCRNNGPRHNKPRHHKNKKGGCRKGMSEHRVNRQNRAQVGGQQMVTLEGGMGFLWGTVGRQRRAQWVVAWGPNRHQCGWHTQWARWGTGWQQ